MNTYRKFEDLEVCPIDPVHMILPHRMAAHILKCKKNYPDRCRNMKVCPFNAVHLVKEEEFLAHLGECPDNNVVERDLYIHRKDDQEIIEEEPVFQPSIPFENTWNEQHNVLRFDPAEDALHKDVIRATPTGLGKAGRREWKIKEQLRLERIKQGLSVSDIVFPSADGYDSLGSSYAEVENKLVKQNEDVITPSKLKTCTNVVEHKPEPPVFKRIENDVMNVKHTVRRPKISGIPNNRIAANIFGKKTISSTFSDIKRSMLGISVDNSDSFNMSGYQMENKMSVGRGSFIRRIESLSLN